MSTAWILVAILSVVVIYLLATRNRAGKGAGRTEAGRTPGVGDSRAGPTSAIADAPGNGAPGVGETGMAHMMAEVEKPGAGSVDEHEAPGAESRGHRSHGSREGDVTRALLEQLLDYLERAPLSYLREADDRFDLPDLAVDALHALEDLAFYGTEPDDTVRKESLSHLVQGVTREYADEHGIRVRVTGPERPVVFRVASEWLKDIVYLGLANAHHFGDGDGIEVRLNGGPGVAALIEIRDFGDGFTDEALENAFAPFWTTDPAAPGLGLFHARILMGEMGGRIDLDNHPEGGGRIRILLPAQPPSEVGMGGDAGADEGDGAPYGEAPDFEDPDSDSEWGDPPRDE